MLRDLYKLSFNCLGVSSCHFKVSLASPAHSAGLLYDGIIFLYYVILFTLLESPSTTSAANVPVTLFIDPSIKNADAIFNQAKEDVLQFASNVSLENVVYESGACGILESDTKDIFSYFQNYHAKNYRITMGPTCSSNLLRFANLTAEIQALEINILKGYPYEHPTMIDMVTRSPQNLGENLVAILRGFEWAQVGAVLCEECYADDQLASESYFSAIEGILEANNIALKEVLKVKKGENSQSISQSISIFEPSARVLLLFLGNELKDYSEFLSAMRLNNYTTEEYTPVIVLSKYSSEFSLPWQNDASMTDLFDKTIIIHNNCYDKSKISTFLSKYSFSSIDETITSLQMYEGYHLLGYYLYTATTNTTLFNYVSPEKAISTMDVHGPFGDIYINTNGQRIAGYDVILVNKSETTTNFITNLGRATTNKKCPRLACLHFEINSTTSSTFEPPKDVPLCGFHGEICDQTGDDGITISSVIYAILVVIAIVCIFIILYVGLRRLYVSTKGRSVSNPWLIPFNDIKFIDLTTTDLSQQMSIQSLKQRLAERNNSKTMAKAKQIATVEQTYVLVDKFVIRDKIRYDRSDLHILYQMKSHLSHDNINNFIGISFDRASHIYTLVAQCFRGSLYDHIFAKQTNRGAADNFEGAFLRDILKGLEFLHASQLEYHGNLSLHNCMLDSHWIVKVGGFGLNRLLIKWKAAGQIFTENHTPIIRSEELHYHDPALKAIWRTYTGAKSDKALVNGAFGRKCDIYSFGVCLYEIYFKRQFVVPLYDLPKDSSDDESILIDEQNDEIASKYPLPLPLPENADIHPDLLRILEKCLSSDRPKIQLIRKVIDTVLKMQGSLVDLMIKNLQNYTQGLTETVEARTVQLLKEQRKSDILLRELIPESIAREIKNGILIEAKEYKNATILYSDIVGFTSLCSQSKPMEVVTLLSGMYQRFDLIISQNGGYKMETIGDAYCVAAGLPIANLYEHVDSICMIALLQRECLHNFEIPHRPGKYLNCRWGFNSGSVFSGVIGVKAPRYACFGESVSLASKMESTGMEDRIQMTFGSQKIIRNHYSRKYLLSQRGGVSIDSHGHLLTFWLEGFTNKEESMGRFHENLNEDLIKMAKEYGTPLPTFTEQPKNKIIIAKEKVNAEKKEEEERLQRQLTLHEALEEHEEEVEMDVVLKDKDEKNDSIDLASIISTQIDGDDDDDDDDEDEGNGRTIGHGRLDSQASTIPEN